LRVLADTSVWVAHFRQHNKHLAALLHSGLILCHPHIVVEVACGTPPTRRITLSLLGKLEQAPVATHAELLALVERRQLLGRGCGFVDISLLASTLLDERISLWTLDKRLAALASELGRQYRPIPLQ
jgi:predicted nucleic acid-binding protein